MVVYGGTFVDLLIDDINMGIGHGLTIISDGHKGLLEAVSERIPAAEHRQCARHIYANFKKKFKGEHFRKLFWAAAGSTIRERFEHQMKEISVLEPLAYAHLMEKDPKSWCKAFFQVDRCCDAYENGISESFNAVIEEARKRPVITMLEEIRIYVMTRMYDMHTKGHGWNLEICPFVRVKLENLKKQQRYWVVLPCGFQQFEARLGNDVYAVDLSNKTCGCRAWQLTGIPCVHGMAAISNLNGNAEDYVAPWLSTDMFLKSYKYNIRPVNGSDMWPEVDYTKPLPPKQRRLPGRPTVKRKRDPSEMDLMGKTRIPKTGAVLKCSLCKEKGHNKTTCWKNKKEKSKTHQGSTIVQEKSKTHQGSTVVQETSLEMPPAVTPVSTEAATASEVPPVSTEAVTASEVPPLSTEAATTSPVQMEREPMQRVRRHSQRITKKKLGKKVDIKEGGSHEHPLDLE
ncbi:hypothetical protein OSB04_017755 [Centaurea solstitialis]|uniref:SWIM-type domain-containing protein n=1 Tax=Centaurea solstitialis TaxID=347529 RepID=A0AA38T3G8_9ASTR|nr:hypothetical protein OSB04_017755 [Centaurea solstitialis]